MQLSLQSIQQRTSWFTMERREWVAAVFLAAVVGFGIGNGHTTQNSIANISDQLGQKKAAVKTLQAKAGCEKWRASVATTVAKEAIKGAVEASAPIPDTREIPADHCAR